MGGIAAIGAMVDIQGFGLAGVRVLPADGPDEVRSAWRGLDEAVELVILTANAAAALAGEPPAEHPLTAVLPS
ncbi:hypothetical protein [Myceligenerans indicum]|nr:hypothetical protein [Myceligenerans indicum]